MRFPDVASGFFAVTLVATFSIAPTFISREAAAKLRVTRTTTRTATRAHPIETKARRRNDDLRVRGIDGEEAAPAPAPAPIVRASAPAGKAPARANVDLSALHADIAVQLSTVGMCRRGGGPEGPGVIEMTYVGDGSVRVATAAPYAKTAVGACVARRFAAVAPTFEGDPVTVRVRFEL